MAYFVADDKAFFVDEDGKAHALGVSVTEKVQTIVEIDEVIPTVGKATKLPANAVPASLEEIVAKFQITADNPLTVAKAAK